MKKGRVIFALCLLALTVIAIIITLGYPFKSKLFPLFALSVTLVLLVYQAFRDIADLKREGPKEGDTRLRREHFIIPAWLLGALLMLWLLGFMGTVVLLPFLYLRFSREGWVISLSLPVGCGLFFYGLFGLALNMPLYPGILFSKLFE
jgi:hypothetical protein